MQRDRKFKKSFYKLYDELKTGKSKSDEVIEEYVARYISPAEALRLKRSRKVIGGCSMDDSPRLHALAIAELAGETANWEIFLRSHLDIMNDRFDRVSDGSYAWGMRKTYIKELEVMNINVQDLLLGTSLRIGNPSLNHYFGSIGRVGRTLAESKDKETLQQEILAMVQDNSLDDYNRLIMYYLFSNYNYSLEAETERDTNASLLLAAAQTLPEYLRPEITNEQHK